MKEKNTVLDDVIGEANNRFGMNHGLAHEVLDCWSNV